MTIRFHPLDDPDLLTTYVARASLDFPIPNVSMAAIERGSVRVKDLLVLADLGLNERNLVTGGFFKLLVRGQRSE